jgi:uncharacterized protein YbjT (DUF2867 family)
MNKVILFGASGNLGKEIAKKLVGKGFELILAVRSKEKGESLSGICPNYLIVDINNSESIKVAISNQDIIISALGKSVSPNDKSKATFREVDYQGNMNILVEVQKSLIKKFIYVSAFQAEKYPQLEYFKVHQDFSEKLIQSGLNYSIIKPPAIFCAFLDMIEMARKGQLISIGKGEKKTNPIYEGDLAEIIVESVQTRNTIIEAGGKYTYTRLQLLEIIQQEVNKSKKIRVIPFFMFNMLLFLMKFFDKNGYDKFAFFSEVMKHDTLAPEKGSYSFEEYIKEQVMNLKK